MEELTTSSALHMLWKSHKRWNINCPRVRIHNTARRLTQLGVFDRLRLDDCRFQRYESRSSQLDSPTARRQWRRAERLNADWLSQHSVGQISSPQLNNFNTRHIFGTALFALFAPFTPLGGNVSYWHPFGSMHWFVLNTCAVCVNAA